MGGTRNTSQPESEARPPEPAPASRPVGCPRCGYDQRGAIAQWRDRCPLEGRCTECGYTYESADLFDPYRRTPGWLVECCRWRRFPWAVLMTLLRSLVPWRFWRWQNLAYPLRPGRLALYLALVLILPAAVLYGVLQGGVGIAARMSLQQQISQANDEAPQLLAHYESALELWMKATEYEDAPLRLRQQFNLHYTQHPESFRSPEHSKLWNEYRQLQLEFNQRSIGWLQRASDDPHRIDHSYLAAAMEPILFPTRPRSSGRIMGAGQVNPYPPPTELVYYIEIGSTGTSVYSFLMLGDELLASLFLTVWLMTVIGFVVFPITLVLLPTTRRRAKVRAVHFVRVAAYGLAIPTFIIWLAAACLTANTLGWVSNEVLDWIEVIVAFAIPLTAASWWYLALRCHLRIPHAFWVTLIMGILTILILLVPVGVMAAIDWLIHGAF